MVVFEIGDMLYYHTTNEAGYSQSELAQEGIMTVFIADTKTSGAYLKVVEVID